MELLSPGEWKYMIFEDCQLPAFGFTPTSWDVWPRGARSQVGHNCYSKANYKKEFERAQGRNAFPNGSIYRNLLVLRRKLFDTFEPKGVQGFSNHAMVLEDWGHTAEHPWGLNALENPINIKSEILPVVRSLENQRLVCRRKRESALTLDLFNIWAHIKIQRGFYLAPMNQPPISKQRYRDVDYMTSDRWHGREFWNL